MNKVVLVTGASRGLGFEIAKLFLEDDNTVYVNYNSTRVDELREKYRKYLKAKFIKCDVSNETEVINMFKQIKEEEGVLDILVNNAGISIDSDIRDKRVLDFKKVLDVNLIGPFLTCKYAKDIMPSGSIINISSTNGIDTYYSYSLDYDASKSGVISLTHNFASMYAPDIRVNCVAPGWMNTNMNKELDQEFIDEENKKILLKRFAEPIEVAEVVFFLASDKASYINNTVIRVDGGIN